MFSQKEMELMYSVIPPPKLWCCVLGFAVGVTITIIAIILGVTFL